jgi:hypothetical protein
MKTRQRPPTGVLVAMAILAMAGVVAAVIYAGTLVAVDGAASAQGSTRASLWILLGGGVVMVAIFSAFLFIGIEDGRDGVPFSPLYWPQTAVKGSMCAYMMTTSLTVVDFLKHGLHPHWTPLYTPVARIFQSILLLAVFASFVWVLVTVIRGRRDERRRHADEGQER